MQLREWNFPFFTPTNTWRENCQFIGGWAGSVAPQEFVVFDPSESVLDPG